MIPAGSPCRVAGDHGQLEQQLDSFAPDVCLMNFSCDSVAIDDVGMIREQRRWQNIPLVGVGYGTPEQMRIQAYRNGIDDFLDDLSSAEELNWKVRRWAQFFRSSELGSSMTAFLDVLRDDELSPFAPLIHATGVLRNVPAFKEHEQLSMWLDGIDIMSEDMASRIDLLRDYLRCREGEQAFTPMACSVGAALLPQLDIWREHINVPGVQIITPETGMETQVTADFSSLKRILRWMGNNACEHARSKVTVTITEEMGMVNIDVTDDGDGFEADEVEQVFAGFQVGSRLNLPYQLGLHLSLAREMLRFQDGLIEVAQPGPGNTTVRIVLPLAG